MVNQLSWKVGGQQGEGIESTGEIFSIALNRLRLLFIWVSSLLITN